MVEKYGFCSRTLTSIPGLIDHYANSHNTTKGTRAQSLRVMWIF